MNVDREGERKIGFYRVLNKEARKMRERLDYGLKNI